MKAALGNLAIVCSRNKDCLLRMFDGKVDVYIGQGPERGFRTCSVDDEKAIREIIEFLVFGREVKK